eukprot:UN15460
MVHRMSDLSYHNYVPFEIIPKLSGAYV